MINKSFILISFLFIVSFCPSVNSISCKESKESCENADPDAGDELCCLWKLPKNVNELGDSFWLKSDDNLKGEFYQHCGSLNNLQYKTRSAYGARKSREYGLDQNIIIDCSSYSKDKLPKESEPCRKSTDSYSTAPSKDTCGPKTVEGEKGDSMCCYWKPTGTSNQKGFLDKDECAAINDDQFCNLDYYKEKKKKKYGLTNLEIVCPDQKTDYCSKNYCFGSTEVGGDGPYYCERRPIYQKLLDEGDKYCLTWNPTKEKTTNTKYAYLNGRTICGSVSEEQYNNIDSYIAKKKTDTNMENLTIIRQRDVNKCEDIKDISKCKYSLGNEGNKELCSGLSLPTTTTATKEFWLMTDDRKKGSNYEGCGSMSIQEYKDQNSYKAKLKNEYGLSNDVVIKFEEGGTNEIPETSEKSDGKGAYTKSGENLKVSLIIVLGLIYLMV